MPRYPDSASDAHWRDLLRGFAASGLSVREFCACHGIPPSRFYSRRRALAAPAASPGSPPPSPGVPLFVPLRVAGPGAGPAPGPAGGPAPASGEGRIELLLEGGVTVRLCGEVPAARLASVLDVLRVRGGPTC